MEILDLLCSMNKWKYSGAVQPVPIGIDSVWGQEILLTNLLADLSRFEIRMRVLIAFVTVVFLSVLQEKAFESLDEEEVE